MNQRSYEMKTQMRVRLKVKKEFANNDEPGFAIGHIKKHGTLVNHTDAHMILLGIAGSGKNLKNTFRKYKTQCFIK